MDQASYNCNIMDGECEDSTSGQSMTELALEGNIVQGKTGIASGRTYIAVSQKTLTVLNIKISCPCSIQSVYPKIMHNLQKICKVMLKITKRFGNFFVSHWKILKLYVLVLFYNASAKNIQKNCTLRKSKEQSHIIFRNF